MPYCDISTTTNIANFPNTPMAAANGLKWPTNHSNRCNRQHSLHLRCIDTIRFISKIRCCRKQPKLQFLTLVMVLFASYSNLAELVSLLEPDNETYNTGIVDMSHRYEKMYVIRPQFFIPIITLLVQAAKKSLECKRQLAIAQSKEIDVTNFEKKLDEFRSPRNISTKMILKITRNHQIHLNMRFVKKRTEFSPSGSTTTSTVSPTTKHADSSTTTWMPISTWTACSTPSASPRPSSTRQNSPNPRRAARRVHLHLRHSCRLPPLTYSPHFTYTYNSTAMLVSFSYLCTQKSINNIIINQLSQVKENKEFKELQGVTRHQSLLRCISLK